MNREQEFYDSLAILDTEATSKDPFEAEVIEVGIHFPKLELNVEDLYKPVDGKVPYEVQAVTNITTEMVANSKLFKDGSEKINELINSFDGVVAHNIWYDKNLLEKYDVKHPTWLCTMRLAKQLYLTDESVDAFNLAYLRYRLHAKVDNVGEAHRALADVHVTHAVLKELVNEMKSRELLDEESPWLGQIIAFIEQPLKILKMPFGKHKGSLLEDVPLSYWKWAMANLDSLDEGSDMYDADFADSVAEAIEKQM